MAAKMKISSVAGWKRRTSNHLFLGPRYSIDLDSLALLFYLPIVNVALFVKRRVTYTHASFRLVFVYVILGYCHIE